MDAYLFNPDHEPVLQGINSVAVFPVSYFSDKTTLKLMIPHIVASIFLVVFGVWTIGINTLLNQTGMDAVATVIDRDKDVGEKGHTLTYQFEAGGKTYKKKISVGASLYDKYAPDHLLKIVYLSTDPNYSKIKSDSNAGINWLSINTYTPFMIIVVFPGGTAYVVYREIARQKRNDKLRQNGRVVIGELISLNVIQKSVFEINVYFETPDTNEFITDKRKYLYKGFKRELPKAGTPIAVLYLDKNTWHVL